MSEQNKAIMRRIFDEVFNEGNLALVDELVAKDSIEHENNAHGAEGFKQTVAVFRTAFPDIQISVDDMIAEGDKVVARITMRGTHQGEFMGIPATGKTIAVQGIDIVRFANGKAVEHWGVTDSAAMMAQLGVAPPVSGRRPA